MHLTVGNARDARSNAMEILHVTIAIAPMRGAFTPKRSRLARLAIQREPPFFVLGFLLRFDRDIDLIKRELEMLHEQVNLLVYPGLQSFESPTPTLSQVDGQCLPGQTPTALPQPKVNGPYSSPSTQGTATGSLQGIAIHPAKNQTEGVPINHQKTTIKALQPAYGSIAVPCHPLLSISQAEAMRLIEVYEDECGSVYPLIDIGYIQKFARDFYTRISASQKPATWHTFQLDQHSTKPFRSMEMVLAIALVIEDCGSNHLSSALVDDLEAEMDHRPCGVSFDTHFVEILTLMVCNIPINLVQSETETFEEPLPVLS